MVSPKGTATNGIDLGKTRLTGSVVHYADKNLVRFAGDWKQRTIGGFWGLFSFNLLEADRATPAEISYGLPIVEDGIYQVSLLYLPGGKYASNAKIQVHHADGVSEQSWNMKNGDKFGFALEIGTYRFQKGRPARVRISNEGADGMLVADSVGFVKLAAK